VNSKSSTHPRRKGHPVCCPAGQLLVIQPLSYLYPAVQLLLSSRSVTCSQPCSCFYSAAPLLVASRAVACIQPCSCLYPAAQLLEFSRAVACIQPLSHLYPAAPLLVSGHEFTRAARAAKSTSGFSPCRVSHPSLGRGPHGQVLIRGVAGQGWCSERRGFTGCGITSFCASFERARIYPCR
jgi:hypothetical protein